MTMLYCPDDLAARFWYLNTTARLQIAIVMFADLIDPTLADQLILALADDDVWFGYNMQTIRPELRERPAAPSAAGERWTLRHVAAIVTAPAEASER